MPQVSLIGGSGFIGRHLIAAFAQDRAVSMCAVTRAAQADALPAAPNLTWRQGDLADTDTLRAVLVGDGVLIHLAHPRQWTPEQHVRMAERLADAAARARVRRVVLCSTADVVGRSPAARIDESTPCAPYRAYHHAKLGIEDAFARRAAGAFELVVLRPTAVFGPGGRNLVALATHLRTRTDLLNYLHSSLAGRRTMNLVAVENVVAAIQHLTGAPAAVANGVYLVSDDDDPLNNFRDVERALMTGLGRCDYPVPPLPAPASALRLAARLTGRGFANPRRRFDNGRLAATGCTKRVTLRQALPRFAEWFQRQT